MAGAGKGAGRPGGPTDREQKLVREGSPEGEGKKGTSRKGGEREEPGGGGGGPGPRPQCPPPHFLRSQEP